MTISTKKCGYCKQIQPLGNFHRRRAAVDGRQAFCKACRKIVRLLPPTPKTYRSDAEKRNERVQYQKAWIKNNIEKYRAYQKVYHRAWYQTNKRRIKREIHVSD
jgi:hypothetical protein